MGKHRRRKSLSETERAEIVDAATALHRALMGCSASINATSADYHAMAQLNGAIVETVRAVTGEDPPWMRLRTGWPI